MRKLLFFSFMIFTLLVQAQQTSAPLPKGFTYINTYIPNIASDLRYYGNHNFVGRPIDGYEQAVLILSIPAAKALAKVQQELNKQGLGLLIFDAYRPQRAVNHFIRWAALPTDTLNRQEFYPSINKKDLFAKGYIAKRSGHSRGSTVDLSIIDTASKKELDMGTAFDFFGEKSHYSSSQITTAQRANRKLLRSVMEKQGFRGYSEEWWHFTLNKEPYVKTYFDFPVK